jgi:hypothetical protein
MAAPHLTGRSKGRGQTKLVTLSSRFGVGRGTNDRIPEKVTEEAESHTGL